MQAEKLKDRPPYLLFEQRGVEDREASLAAGHYVEKNVDIVIVTPAGSKDRIERVATEWLDQRKVDVEQGRCPKEWYNEFKEAYKLWKEGKELPLNGTALQTWPPISPALYKTLVQLGVRTVEDLAVANEETLMRIGMGAVSLKQRAQDWLKDAEGPGKINAIVTDLRAKNAGLVQRNTELEQRLQGLEARVGALVSAKVESPSSANSALEG